MVTWCQTKNNVGIGLKDHPDFYFHVISGYYRRSLNKRQLSALLAPVSEILYSDFISLCADQKAFVRIWVSVLDLTLASKFSDPNCNSVVAAELQASSKTWPFFVCRGWDAGFGGRSKAYEFQRVGSFAPVGGDGFVVSFLWCVFPLCF